MALKYVISKSQFDKLTDELKIEYKPDGENFKLDVSDLPQPEDNGALKRAKDRLAEENEDLKGEIKTLTTKVTKLEAAGNAGDVTKLTERHERQLARQKEEADAVINGLKQHITKTMVASEARTLATKLSKHPDLMVDHILPRMTVEFDADNNPTLKVLKEGKASDMTIDKLGEELKADKKFAPILTGSQASGGGAPASGLPPAPLGSSASTDKPADFSKPDAVPALLDRVRAVREAAANPGATQ